MHVPSPVPHTLSDAARCLLCADASDNADDTDLPDAAVAAKVDVGDGPSPGE